jgi:hypothetical protein
MEDRKQSGTIMTNDIQADSTVFIPSVELRGTRGAKLVQLDGVLAQLEALRRQLAGTGESYTAERPGAGDTSARRWWLAGLGVVALLALLAMWAWVASAPHAWRTTGIPVVHETF